MVWNGDMDVVDLHVGIELGYIYRESPGSVPVPWSGVQPYENIQNIQM